jgi:alkylation response protein AidB-like acyl-CoA dehydrogenase
VLGEVDNGWPVLAETLNSERIMNGANCAGALEGILEDMVAYVRERTTFGKPLGQFQAVQHMIADTYIGLETSRLLAYRAAWLQHLGRPCGVESTLAKLVASEECFAGDPVAHLTPEQFESMERYCEQAALRLDAMNFLQDQVDAIEPEGFLVR